MHGCRRECIIIKYVIIIIIITIKCLFIQMYFTMSGWLFYSVFFHCLPCKCMQIRVVRGLLGTTPPRTSSICFTYGCNQCIVCRWIHCSSFYRLSFLPPPCFLHFVTSIVLPVVWCQPHWPPIPPAESQTFYQGIHYFLGALSSLSANACILNTLFYSQRILQLHLHYSTYNLEILGDASLP